MLFSSARQPLIQGGTRLLLTAVLCHNICGCSLSPLAKRSTEFASAATITTTDTADVYEVVERTYRKAQTARLVANYDKSGFDSTSLRPFLPQHDLDVRIEILSGLMSYAELLAAVSSDQSFTELDDSAKSLGAALGTLSANELSASKLTSTDVNIATTAIDALGRALIEKKRRRELPGILHQMQQPIETICTLLAQDIGDPEHSGLRNELHISYLDLLREQKNYIAENESKLSPADRRDEIRILPQLAISEAHADRALAATQKALLQLARTHTALALTAAQKDSPAFRVQMQQLAAAAQQLKTFYASLSSQS